MMVAILLKLIVYSVLLSCILTPPLYALLQSWMGIDIWPYSRVFDRVILVVAAVLIYRWRSKFGVDSLREYWCELKTRKGWGQVVAGVLIASIFPLALIPVMVGAGTLSWAEHDSAYYIQRCLRLLPAALIISLLEESFFRVILLDKLREKLNLFFASAVCSLIYSVAHFVSPDKKFQFSGYSFSIGFEYLGAVGAKFFQVSVIWGGLGLWLVGLVLCYTILKTRSFSLCVGLHSGWVIAAKASRYFTEVADGVRIPPGVGRRYLLLMEPLVWVAIMASGVLIHLFYVRRKGKQNGS